MNRDTDGFCGACGLALSGYRVPPADELEAPRQPAQPVQPPYHRPLRGREAFEDIRSHIGWAIAVLVLFFPPTGIAAVVFAAQVDSRLSRGDIAGARAASRNAKIWCWITFGVGVVLWALTILLIALYASIGCGYGEGGVIY